MSTPGPCHLCSQIAGHRAGDLIAQMLPGADYARRVVTDSESFASIPSLGPLVDGHLILCAKDHVRSFADVPAALDDEYQQVKRDLKATLDAAYAAETHAFEHGAARSGDRIPCTIDHAHVHLVPAARSIVLDLPDVASWVPFDGSLAALADRTGGREYLVYEAPTGASRVAITHDRPFESQLMRRVFADALGRPDSWDWRAAPEPLAVHRTWKQLALR